MHRTLESNVMIVPSDQDLWDNSLTLPCGPKVSVRSPISVSLFCDLASP